MVARGQDGVEVIRIMYLMLAKEAIMHNVQDVRSVRGMVRVLR